MEAEQTPPRRGPDRPLPNPPYGAYVSAARRADCCRHRLARAWKGKAVLPADVAAKVLADPKLGPLADFEQLTGAVFERGAPLSPELAAGPRAWIEMLDADEAAGEDLILYGLANAARPHNGHLGTVLSAAARLAEGGESWRDLRQDALDALDRLQRIAEGDEHDPRELLGLVIDVRRALVPERFL